MDYRQQIKHYVNLFSVLHDAGFWMESSIVIISQFCNFIKHKSNTEQICFKCNSFDKYADCLKYVGIFLKSFANMFYVKFWSFVDFMNYVDFPRNNGAFIWVYDILWNVSFKIECGRKGKVFSPNLWDERT